MDVLTTSDIEYLSTQSSDKLNLILTGMNFFNGRYSKQGNAYGKSTMV